MLSYLKCLSICNLSIAELIQAALPKMIIFQLGTNRTQYSDNQRTLFRDAAVFY